MVSLLTELKGGSSLIINNKNLCIVTPTGSNVILVESSTWGKVIDAAVLEQSGMLFVLLKSNKMALHAYSLDEAECSITPRSKMSLAFGTHVVPLNGDFFAVTDYDSLDTEMFEWRGDSKTVRRCWVKKGCLPTRVGSEHFSMIQLKRNLLQVWKLDGSEAVHSVNASNRNMTIIDCSSAGNFIFVMYSSCVVTVFEFEGTTIKRLQDLGKVADVGDKRHLMTTRNEDGTFSVWVKGASKMLVINRVISEARGVPPFEKTSVDRPTQAPSQPAKAAASFTPPQPAAAAEVVQGSTPQDEIVETEKEDANAEDSGDNTMYFHAAVVVVTLASCLASVVLAKRYLK